MQSYKLYASLDTLLSLKERQKLATQQIEDILRVLENVLETGEQDSIQVKFYVLFKKAFAHSEELNTKNYDLEIEFENGRKHIVPLSFEEIVLLATTTPKFMDVVVAAFAKINIKVANHFGL